LASDRAKSWLADSVVRACGLHGYAVWGYVFMPEHVHMLVWPKQDEYDISLFLTSVKKAVVVKAKAYRDHSELPDSVWERFLDIQPNGRAYFRFWQRGGGYDRNIWSNDEVMEKLGYMHNNPVARGLCERPQDWRWSSAAYYTEGIEGPIPVEVPTRF
jgi:putative transposase